MRQFIGETFVCFIDISGFKKELKSNYLYAAEMLDVFYSAGYNTIRAHSTLNGIFVSDCGILYSDKGTNSERLLAILSSVKEINKIMLDSNYLTTASIAFGPFEYRKKIAFERIKKNALIGNGYLYAFLDNEDEVNKIHPGQVRILKGITEESHPNPVFEELDLGNSEFKLLESRETHYYYNWFIRNVSEIEKSNEVYKKFIHNTKNEKYEILKTDLKMLLKRSN